MDNDFVIGAFSGVVLATVLWFVVLVMIPISPKQEGIIYSKENNECFMSIKENSSLCRIRISCESVP